MSTLLRVGVVGAGSLGYHHARILRDLAVTFDQKNNRMRVVKPAR